MGDKVHCEEYLQCKAQNGVIFGFAPLSLIKLYTGSPTDWEKISDVIQTHLIVKQSGLPIFYAFEHQYNHNEM